MQSHCQSTEHHKWAVAQELDDGNLGRLAYSIRSHLQHNNPTTDKNCPEATLLEESQGLGRNPYPCPKFGQWNAYLSPPEIPVHIVAGFLN